MRIVDLSKAALVLLFSLITFCPVTAQDSNPGLKSEIKNPCATPASQWLKDCEVKTGETQGLFIDNSDELQQPNSQDPSKTPKDTYVFPSSKKRFNRYAKSTVGPFSLLRSTVSAGIDQWTDSPEEWEQGASGYGKRFASNFGRNAIRQTVSYGLSEALRQDTGFERSKRKGFWPRLSDALIQNVTSRTRSGKRVISAPLIAGAYASSLISVEAWYPERYSYKDGLRSGTYSFATGFAINIVREFVYNW